MYAALAANAGHPTVAALLGLGAAALAGAVVAMAWAVHSRQIRLAEQLARRQFLVVTDPGAPGDPDSVDSGEPTARVNGKAPATPGNGVPSGEGAGHAGPARAGTVKTAGQPGAGQTAAGHSGGPQAGGGQSAPVVIEGPDTVVAGEQVRYRVRPSGNRKVVAWAAGGGAVAQAPDPAHPDELLLIADQPGNLTIIVRVRDGMTERRGTKAVTAVPEVVAPAPFTLRLFLNGWGLVAVTILIAGFAASLDALGNLSSSDFIALVCPLAALLSVVAIARSRGEAPAPHSPGKPTDRLSVHAGRAAEPLLASPPQPAEAPVHNQPAL
jgi:hypothetical protein